ncbi:MAG TPA: EAL domain-containing protein, partial [Dissulfurispiraceae bacterium]
IKDEHGNVVQVVHVARDITERKRLEEEIRHMAYHDTLTGLPNKRLFKDIVNVELAQASRNRKKLAFMFLDLDRFKEINDTLGHEAGDHLLKEVAARLRKTIRASDTLARIGGDEFNMILSDIAQEEDVTVIVRKILSSFQEPFTVDGHELYITTSIGVSIYPDDSGDVEVLLRYADIAMYHAKEHGRNNYQFYSPSINFRSFERIRLENMLRRAVEHGELEMHYQPQVDIKTRRVVCAEALVRWRHPELGLLKPDHFIPLAEGMGFITAIDEWVLRTVGAQIRSWLDMGLPPVCVSVNLSAKEFLNPALTERISRALAETALPPELLNIEITESVAMGNIEHTVARLNELTRMGIRILIDDFGTGYSSLNYLKRLPVQKLKIDKSFVQDIATDSDDRAIIRAVAAMAHNMNISVLAEGVETEEQLSFLRSARCDEAQGYLFSEPVPADKFVELFHLAKASSC